MAPASTGSGDEAQNTGDDDLGDTGFGRNTSIFSVISRLSDSTSLSSKKLLSRQCTEIDSLAGDAIDKVRLENLLAEAIKGCKFCVTIGDPRLDDCPLIVVSDRFETMTGYSKHEILGRNCRILSKDCPLNQQDAFELRQTCKTGQPFTGVLLNRKKSGRLFQNLVSLRGLTVASNPHTGQRLWFVVGIQADVTHVSEDELPPDHFAALQSVVGIIREKISDELSTLAVAGLHVIEREQIRTDSPEMWWMLPEPTFVQGSDDEATVSLSVSDIERQTSEELGTSQPPRRQTSVVPDIVDMSMPDVLKTQGIEVDACALSLLEMSSIKETIGQAVLGCQFCVTISDPRLPSCPLLAVSDQFQTITGYSREEVIGSTFAQLSTAGGVDQFQTITGYSREEVIGKNMATLLSSDDKLRNLDEEQRRRACETGEPYTKVFVHRKKSGDLFLDLLDLRGLNVAHNPRTDDNLWFLVCIQADVTHMGEENIPADQMKQLREVAECIRCALADRVAAMGVAGMLTHPSASKNHRSANLWCPSREARCWRDSRQLSKNVATVRQVSFTRSSGCKPTSGQAPSTQPSSTMATSSGVTELIQQQQQQQQQQQHHLPLPLEAELASPTTLRLFPNQIVPALTLAMGLLAAMEYALRKRRKG
eukprot:CAMPEP_0172935248 /NCGR_PEP_ID=MMETSP1075-20121228/221419_1 /TAXON_ID=2916 /ORGANISM="Ceratium fusus, Strain PA161109" /LENGTH=649 /DNA_ID=CAMNT_0013796607 /DNA_START=41 /DNA_END=1991 /DNA_ORIENTATION=-